MNTFRIFAAKEPVLAIIATMTESLRPPESPRSPYVGTPHALQISSVVAEGRAIFSVVRSVLIDKVTGYLTTGLIQMDISYVTGAPGSDERCEDLVHALLRLRAFVSYYRGDRDANNELMRLVVDASHDLDRAMVPEEGQ